MATKDNLWDCLVIGAGPAGLSAAIYTSRENIKTLILEKGVIGGLAAITEKIDNYPGFSQGVAGLKLAEELKQQSERFGAKIEIGQVCKIKPTEDNLFEVTCHQPEATYLTKTVLLASGSDWTKLGVAGEDKFYGRGVHHCATCDGAFYNGQKLAVVGSGNTAAQESLFLTRYASSIDILIRGPAWKASAVLVEKIKQEAKIKVHFNSPVVSLAGEEALTGVNYRQSDQEKQIVAAGLFVFVGLKPMTDYLVGSEVVLDENNFIITNQSFQTNVAGLFAAGDVRSGATMQIASAAGEGASAALAIRHYLDEFWVKEIKKTNF